MQAKALVSVRSIGDWSVERGRGVIGDHIDSALTSQHCSTLGNKLYLHDLTEYKYNQWSINTCKKANVKISLAFVT